MTDSGNWPSGDVSGCVYEQNAIILEGIGTVLMRTDGDTAIYKWVSVREINPTATTGTEGWNGHNVISREPKRTLRQVFYGDDVLHVPASSSDRVRYQVHTLRGRLVKSGVVTKGRTVRGLRQGVYLVRMDEDR